MPQVERPPQVLTNHRQLMSVKGRCAKKRQHATNSKEQNWTLTG